MGLSAPPPSWGTVLGKPTTISGFGITDALTNAVTSQIAGSGINISGATGAVTVSANNGVGDIGTYIIGNRVAASGRNGTYAGSSIGEWIVVNCQNQFSSFGLSGTWRANAYVGVSHNNGPFMFFQRIA